MHCLGLPWQSILPESRLEEILEEENISYRNCVYTPVITLWAMVSQVLDPDKSLSNAVKRMITWRSCSRSRVSLGRYGSYSAKQLTLLYGWRWQVAEINLRHLAHHLAPRNADSENPRHGA